MVVSIFVLFSVIVVISLVELGSSICAGIFPLGNGDFFGLLALNLCGSYPRATALKLGYYGLPGATSSCSDFQN